MRSLSLAYFYPDLMNLYGDKGNVITISQRCAWRGIGLEIDEIYLGVPPKGDFDLAFIGGGQDREQLLVFQDLQRHGDNFKSQVAGGLVVLAICGGFQLLGGRFLTYQGEEISGLEIIDMETIGGQRRLIGNIIIEAWLNGRVETLVGFENHSGQTKLGAGAKPLGIVKRGFGNNGQDGTEGARQNNVFGTYLHGSLLPKNPVFADYLIELALKRKYGERATLEPLDDDLETQAHAAAIARIDERNRRRWVPSWFQK